MNITDFLRERAQQIPDATAIIRVGGRKVTFAELDRVVDSLARRALDQGLRPGQVAAIDTRWPYLFLALSLALARVGVASAAMDLRDDAADVRFRILDQDPPAGGRILRLSLDWFEPPAADVTVVPVPSHADPEALCRLLASSGTTGRPKQIPTSHRQTLLRMEAKNRAVPQPPSPCQIYASGPLGGYGYREALRTLEAGGTVVFVGSVDDLLQAIPRYAVNALVAGPALLQQIVTARPADAVPFPTLAMVEVGGSHLPLPILHAVRAKLCPNVVYAYGSTECGNVASVRFDADDWNPEFVGHVYDWVEIEAVDADDRPLPPGSVGEIRIRGETCATSYYRDPEATAKVFRNGWFHTGDLGSVTADGRLYITGRIDELINVGGDKFSPQNIEGVLLAIPGIVDAAAFALPDADGIPQVWAAVVTSGPLDLGPVFRTCSRELETGAPKYIVRVDAVPRNEGGKILRDAVADIARSRQAESALRAAVGPTTLH